MQISDTDVKTLFDSSMKLAALGKNTDCIASLQDTLELARKRRSTADEAIVEDVLAGQYLLLGKVEEAKTHMLTSLSLARTASNLVVQGDVLVSVASLQQLSSQQDQALKTIDQALDIARQSKSLYLTSRVLGEMSNLQLLAGNKVEARKSIDEALQIDHANHYNWEPGHLLYLANIEAVESRTEKAIEIGKAARDLSIKTENYLIFIQSSLFLGTGLARTNRIDEGLQLLELSRKGISAQNKPLFQSQEAYIQYVSSPYMKIVFLETLGGAYLTAKQFDAALTNWRDLYETATSAGFIMARGESAYKLAAIYQMKKELTKAIEFYAIAAEEFSRGGDEKEQNESLNAEEVLLFQEGEKQKALKVEEELLSSVKKSKTVSSQFICDLIIAELLDGTQEVDRIRTALLDADSLVDSDVTVTGLEPSQILELYLRLADFYGKRQETQQELIALEKGLTPALAMSSATGEKKNDKPLAAIFERLEAIMAQKKDEYRRQTQELNADGADVLVSLEVLQYFEETDASWRGLYDEYRKHLDNDSTLTRLLGLPPKLIARDGGPALLQKNIESMGPLAMRIRPLSLGLLMNYYMSHQRTDLAVRFAREALSVKGWESEMNASWGVAVSCQLAYALMMQKDLKSAVDTVTQCMSGAKKLGIPELLIAANQTNVWVLDAAGKHDEAQESVRFLLTNKPDDPTEYVQLAYMKGQQGDWPAAADAWTKALKLYEDRNDLNGTANAHLQIASSPTLAPDSTQRRVHLEAADDLYRQIASAEGQVGAEVALGAYYKACKNDKLSRVYFDKALSLARRSNKDGLIAQVLSKMGEASESSGKLSDAATDYGRSADLYARQNDLSNEAFQLKNEAIVLDRLQSSDEALRTVIKAKGVADQSGNWAVKYWVRRAMSAIYIGQGQFQYAVDSLRSAKQVSDDANQPLSSAWASLLIAAGLETIGNWEEASQQIGLALPVLQQFNDTDDEFAAYVELMAIYGARESDLKDISKALEFYKIAFQLVSKAHPERAAQLDIDLVEIYWEQSRVKEAIAKASEAREYTRTHKDYTGEAGSLISLAEAQRSDGDLQGAANSLKLAEPLVHRLNNFYTLGRYHYGLAGLYRAQGKLHESIEQYERVVGMLEQFKSNSDPENRRSVADHYDFIYDELIEAYYALGQSNQSQHDVAASKALEYVELNKAKVFSKSWGRSFVDGLRRGVSPSLQDKEIYITKEHDALQSELQQSPTEPRNRQRKELTEKLAKLENSEKDFLRELRRTNPAYAEVRYPEPFEIQKTPLHTGELLVEFKMLEKATVVWLLAGTEQGTTLKASYEITHPRTWFAERIFKIRDAFNGGRPEQFDTRVTDDLLKALFPDSVLPMVEAAKTIIFVPDDILFLMPLEMLSSNGRYPLIGKPTEYFPSSSALRLARASIHGTGEWQQSFLGIADPITSSDDPRYQAVALISDDVRSKTETSDKAKSIDKIVSRGFSLERLPGTADEVSRIAALFTADPLKAEIRTGVDATKQELFRTELSRYQFIHFATHGILPVEAGIREPSLVLSYDGKGKDNMLLTLSEILDLKLHADMVVLSACNTGSGKVEKAEGVSSLGSAFLAAGASSVTVSLWHVADRSTAELMEEFYKNLVKGKTKSESLAAARAVMFSKDYVNHNPYFWAPFVLTGE